MAGLGDRFSQWIDERARAWRGAVASWLIDSGVKGTEAVVNAIEPEMLAGIKDQLKALRDMPDMSPEYKKVIDQALATGHFGAIGAILPYLVGFILGLASAVSKQQLEPVMQQLAKLSPYHTPGLPEVLDLKLRRGMTDEQYADLVGRTGWSKEWADVFYDLKHPTLPSEIALSAWMRNNTRFQWAVDNLPRLGLTERDIELLSEMQWRVPGVQDIIRYVVKEAYDEATVEEFGQDQEYPGQAEADAAKTGIRPEQLKLEWRSHWDLPGVSQGYEMMHRGEISPDQLARLLKARDVMPFWRDKLTAISWNLPGRIELRMMALYGLIGKAELMTALEKDGLAEEFRPAVANMNLIRGIKTDIQTRYTNGWINAADVLAELTAALEDPVMADKVYKTIVKNASAARTATQKNLTLAQIEKGVKKGKISRAEGIVLIQDIGYDLQEATYLLEVDVPEDDTDAAVSVRELTKADILAGLKSNAIQLPEARTRLIALRYMPADADYILRVYQLSINPPDDPVERDISKADITQAVKLGLITPTHGYALLRRISFSDEAATFILALVPESSPFSPLNYDEFKALTTSWRTSQGIATEVLPSPAQELRLAQAQAVAEGRSPVLETLRIQIDTIRRQRRSGAITREQEIAALTNLQVPADYLTAIVANDDARIAARK